MFEGICEAIHRELHKMDEKYSNGTQLSETDLKDINTMAHALKSLATYEAMDEAYPRNRGRERGYGYGRRY